MQVKMQVDVKRSKFRKYNRHVSRTIPKQHQGQRRRTMNICLPWRTHDSEGQGISYLKWPWSWKGSEIVQKERLGQKSVVDKRSKEYRKRVA